MSKSDVAKIIIVTWSTDIIAYFEKVIISMLGASDSIILCILVLNL